GNEEEKKPKKSQASMLQEIETLVNRDVIGKINFPSMHECHAESCAVPDENGAHTFIFTDGVYGFSLKPEPVDAHRTTGDLSEQIGNN
ncbi:MAG: hypothetical protein K5649_04660, partial [Lachnospiraceae bacterium]|nr:hypothetical protein [Lachnospiraceae bacterium]